MTCPHCPAAKNSLHEFAKERQDIDVFELSLHDPAAQRIAQGFGVQSVPTFIIQGPAHEGNIGLVGSQAKSTLHKYVNKALGKENKKAKESIFTRFKKKFQS